MRYLVIRKKSGIHTSTYAQTVYHHGSAMDHTYRKKTMNANELAELIEHLENAKYIGASKAATMLRQQQAEIEALKGDGKICARCGAIAYDPVITQTAKTELQMEWTDEQKQKLKEFLAEVFGWDKK